MKVFYFEANHVFDTRHYYLILMSRRAVRIEALMKLIPSFFELRNISSEKFLEYISGW